MSSRTPQKQRIATVKIVAIYALFGLAWIYGSDNVLGWLVHDSAVMVKIAVVKGSLFILCTATLLYFLISRFASQLTTAEDSSIEYMKNYEGIFNATNEAIFVHDAQSGRITDINERMLEIFGYERDEALAADIGDMSEGSYPYSHAEAVENVRKAMLEGPQLFEWLSRKKSGELFWSEVSLKRVHSVDHDRIIAVVRDISERKQAEEALRKSESHYRSLFDISLIGVSVVNKDSVIIEANRAFCNMVGYSKNELIGKMTFAAITHPDDVTSSIKMVKRLMNHNMEHYSLEKRYIAKSGETINGLIYVRGHYNQSGEYEGCTASILNITERKKAEELLQKSEEKYRNLFNNAEVAIFRSRLDGSELLDANQKFLDMLGMTQEEAINKPSMILWADAKEREEMVRRLLADGRVSDYEYKMLDRQGNIKNCITSLVLYREQGILEGSILDITKLKQAEEDRILLEKQFLHAQKLESLGVLAGGIAHDFNNILMAIIGNADLALMRINKESPVVDNLHKIEQSAARAADLAKQMLAYSGKGKFLVENLDLNNLLKDMLHILEVSISKKAVLRLNLHQQLHTVEADATQLRQIIMNLVINASEAIGDKSGVIAISTGCMDCDNTYLKNGWLDNDTTEGPKVYLEIADTGCGMSKETVSKLFDPFFTTKFTGRGLGMSAVLGIIRGHKGAIMGLQRTR